MSPYRTTPPATRPARIQGHWLVRLIRKLMLTRPRRARCYFCHRTRLFKNLKFGACGGGVMWATCIERPACRAQFRDYLWDD